MLGVGLASMALTVYGTVGAQTSAYRAPRARYGKPDLNGIWQAMNTAN